MNTLLRIVSRGAFLVVALVVLALPAWAADKVHLKDGRVVEGTIIREEQGHVWIKGKIGTQYFGPDQVAKIERDAGDVSGEAANKPAEKKKEAPAARAAGVPRAAVISLGDRDNHMVGVYLSAQILKEAVPLLQEEQVDVVVLRVSSGGGYTFEVQRLSDAIEYDLKPHFRVVAWIESAISAAAMTAHACEEIFFMREGQYGACTEFSGALVATKDRPLEERLFQMEKISEQRGKYDTRIMKAMQIMEPLSCTIDERGEVHWYQDLSGEHIVNGEGRILVFNSKQAEQFHFSKGTADTVEELAPLLGYQEVEWVGEHVRGLPYPVCKAEKRTREFRKRTATDEKNLQMYFDNYTAAVGMAEGAADRKDRGKWVSIARGWLDKIDNTVKNNQNLGILIRGTVERFKEWMREQREFLQDLLSR